MSGEEFEDPILLTQKEREARKLDTWIKIARWGVVVCLVLSAACSFALKTYLYEIVNLNAALEYGFGTVVLLQFSIFFFLLECALKFKRHLGAKDDIS